MKKILDALAATLEWTVAGLFATLFLVTLLNIVLRNLGGIAWLWIPGFSRLVFIWLVFLGIAAAYRRGEHLKVDFFLHSLPRVTGAWVSFAIHLALLPFFALLLRYGLQVAEVRMRIPFDTWDVPTGYAYFAVPVSAVALLLFGLERLRALMKEIRTP